MFNMSGGKRVKTGTKAFAYLRPECEHLRALVVLVPIIIRNVLSLASEQRAPKSAHIVELASGKRFKI